MNARKPNITIGVDNAENSLDSIQRNVRNFNTIPLWFHHGDVKHGFEKLTSSAQDNPMRWELVPFRDEDNVTGYVMVEEI